MALLIGVPKETAAGEKRVATVPEVVEKLVKLGFSVAVESGAGDAANFADDTYRAAGAEVVATAAELWAKSDIVFKVRAPERRRSRPAARRRHADQLHLAGAEPRADAAAGGAQGHRAGHRLACRASCRRAQKMDALTSMAGISGYRAVIEAANAFGRFFNGQITAAGKIPPAKVFIAGAGVAGLAAIGTAANLGAIVRANDTRAEVADQVVSLGGEFVKVDYEEEGSGGGGYAKVMSEGFQQAQREMYAKQAKEVGHHHHHRADPRQARAQADHRRDGAEHEAGQRHRRHGRRAGRQLRADRARRGGGAARRHHHRLHRPGQPPGQAVVDAVLDQPAAPDRGAVQDQGRRHRRQHGRRRHPRPDGHQGRQHHLAAAAAQAARAAAAQAGRRGRRAGGQEGPRPRRAASRCRRKSPGDGVRRRRARCSCSSACTRRPASCRTSPCSCWPASSATWWSGTSRRRCTRR